MRIHFGKHKGKDITDLPSSYLYWFVNNVEEDHTELYKAIDQEYNHREHTNSHWEED